MGFSQATLKPVDPDGPEIKALFNPTQYSLDGGNRFNTHQVPALGTTVPQYTSGEARTLSLELYFDTFEERGDVRDHTNKVYGLLELESQKHRPAICKFMWGNFTFTCFVERVGGRFTLFLEDGTPVRATLAVTLKEYTAVDEQAKRDRLASADHVKTRIVRPRDTLSDIAAQEYGSPELWRPIAEANRIANPRRLDPGQVLVVPALTGDRAP